MRNLKSKFLNSKTLAFICLLVFSSFASAEAIYCGGKLTATYVTTNGDVTISGSWRGSYTRICNLNQKTGNVSPLTCSMWASLASSSLVNNKKVLLNYNVDSGVTCATLPTYNNAPIPGYFMQRSENAP